MSTPLWETLAFLWKIWTWEMAWRWLYYFNTSPENLGPTSKQKRVFVCLFACLFFFLRNANLMYTCTPPLLIIAIPVCWSYTACEISSVIRYYVVVYLCNLLQTWRGPWVCAKVKCSQDPEFQLASKSYEGAALLSERYRRVSDSITFLNIKV